MSDHETTIQQLYDEYADSIYRFIYWHTSDQLLAEDIMSEVFYKAWLHHTKLKPETSRAWLYRVARNLIIDHHRRKKPIPMADDEEIEADFDLHLEAEKSESRTMIHQALAKLDDTGRSIIVMRFFQKLSVREVADILHKSEGNIRIMQYRALQELKGLLHHV